MRILILNGPNLNLLGIRQPNLYGKEGYPQLVEMLAEEAAALGAEVRFVQSNHEGALVDAIQSAGKDCDGILINAGAYTHTSIAILDALLAAGLPAAEVHITDIMKREPFRRVSYAGLGCMAHFIGRGLAGYREALEFLAAVIQKGENTK